MFSELVKLVDNYFSFVDERGALAARYDEAHRLCSQNDATLWDINTGPALRGGNLRADKEVARRVLEAFRSVPQVAEQLKNDEILTRLNVVFGKKPSE